MQLPLCIIGHRASPHARFFCPLCPTRRRIRRRQSHQGEFWQECLANQRQVKERCSFNAASNAYMISINEAMGFRARAGWTNWQVVL